MNTYGNKWMRCVVTAGIVFALTSLAGAQTKGWKVMGYDLAGSRLYPYASILTQGPMSFDAAWSVPGQSVRTADMTGNGRVEVVVDDGGSVGIYQGSGALITSFPVAGPSGQIVVGDVAGDSQMEVLRPYQQGSTHSVAAYDTDGNVVRVFARGGGASDNTLNPYAVADLDGNGTQEVVTCGGSGYGVGFRGIAVFNADTASQIGSYDQGPFSTFDRSSWLSIADYDGNGSMEIVNGSGGPANGKSANGMADSQSWVVAHNDDTSLRWKRQFEGSGFVDAEATISDVFGTESPVIVATSLSHGWGTWDGNLGRAYILDPNTGQTVPGYERNFGKPVRVEGVADLNGDGVSEILISQRNGSTHIGSLMALDASDGLPIESQFSVSGSPIQVGVINDIDGDGSLDILSYAGSTLYLLDSDLNVWWSWQGSDAIRDAFVSDLNDDGLNDIIFMTGSASGDYNVHAFTAVPEPATMSLLAVGGLAALRRRKRRIRAY